MNGSTNRKAADERNQWQSRIGRRRTTKASEGNRRHRKECPSNLQAVVLDGNQWQSMAINSNHLRAVVLDGNQWQSMAINSNHLQAVVLDGNQWQSMAINSNHLRAMVLDGNQWQPMAITCRR